MDKINTWYRALSERDRKLFKVLLVLSVMSAYLFWAASIWQKMFHAQKMADRKANRIETRIGDLKMPELEAGISERAASDLKIDIEQQKVALRKLLSDRLPLDRVSEREEMKLEIARLARQNRIAVVRFNATDTELREPLQLVSGESLRRYYEVRPTFHLQLEGEFFGLSSFIQDLSSLSYYNFVSNLQVEKQSIQTPVLSITMELSI